MQPYWAYSCRTHLVTSVCGHPSGVLSPTGVSLATTTKYFDFVTSTVNLDCQVVHLDFNWEGLRGLKEKYGSDVRIDDPGHLGAVLVTSESEKVSSGEMVDEFGIELLDDYMARSIAHRQDPRNAEPEPVM